MNKIYFVLLFIVFNLLVTNISTKASNDDLNQNEPPSGMEIINVGTDGQQLILPKGTKMRKVGAQLIIEDNAEYVAERIWNLEKRLKKLESENEEFKKELQELKDSAH